MTHSSIRRCCNASPTDELTGEDWSVYPLAEAIAKLKAGEDDGTILVHGGPVFAQSLTRLELVDEQRFRSGALAQTLVPRR